VNVFNGAGEGVRYGPDAGVAAPWKSGQIVIGTAVPETVEKRQRVDALGAPETEGSPQADPGSVGDELRHRGCFGRAKRHGTSSSDDVLMSRNILGSVGHSRNRRARVRSVAG
jgi:hypothetical protein